MDENPFSVSLREPYGRVGTAAAPTVIDVRADPLFAVADADAWIIAEVSRSPQAADVRGIRNTLRTPSRRLSVGGEDTRRRLGGKAARSERCALADGSGHT
jgi:hypothetical protein